MSEPRTKYAIQAGIGKGFLREIFAGKRFIKCLIELIKNSRDWGASRIHIITENLEDLVIIDNGTGLNRVNRDAFLSINQTSAHGANQAGNFGTGSKQLLFSHALYVRVRTAPQESPDQVFVFEFSTEEYEQLAFEKGTLSPTILPKNCNTWPHSRTENGIVLDEFGTEITYTLAKPKSTSIYRGARLASELAAWLPRKFEDIVSVDDITHLPAKEIIGQPFVLNENIPTLGVLSIDLYRPRSRRGEDGLRLTGHEIGEATIASFILATNGLPTASRLHPIYSHPELAGTISAAFLSQYATESRDALAPSIADDKRTIVFIRALNRLANNITKAVELKQETNDSSDDESCVHDFIERVNSHFNPDHEPHPDDMSADQPTFPNDDDIPDDTVHPRGAVINIRHVHEVEIGEKIVFVATVRKDVEYSAKDIQWHHDRSHCHKAVVDGGTLTLIAQQHGTGMVQAEIPGTTFTAVARFQVVTSRLFNVFPAECSVEVGQTVRFTAHNVDKLKGPLSWKLEGPGQLKPGKTTALYLAQRAGNARIIACDSSHPDHASVSGIRVEQAAKKNLLRVHDTWLEVEFNTFQSDEFRRPCFIMRHLPYNRLFINVAHPAYQAAKRKSHVIEFLWHAVALEFARFERFAQNDMEDGTYTSAEVDELLKEIMSSGYALHKELTAG